MSINLHNIQEPKKATTLNQAPVIKVGSLFNHPLFDLPFRSYFLLAPAFAIASLGLWLGFLNGLFNVTGHGLTPTIWHIHEMIFAFAATIAIAFILTAAQTWTGSRSLHGKPLALLILLWIACRIALYINSDVSINIAILLQSIWWLSVIALYTKLVLVVNNQRNYVFIPLMLIMAMLNMSILLADRSGNTLLALHLSRTMILVFVLLMAIVGGRVIPFFTLKGAKTKKITTPPWISYLLIFVSLIGLLVFTLGYFISLPIKPAAFMIAASILHAIRLSYWRSIDTTSVPLLWSLHSAYAFISLGLLMLGLSYYQVGISFSDALHLITIGAISLMILSMMSRVSLGHTGRTLAIKKIVSFAFILLLSAALIRSFVPNIAAHFIPEIAPNFSLNIVQLSWNISGGLWVISMLIFLIIYWPILSSAKK